VVKGGLGSEKRYMVGTMSTLIDELMRVLATSESHRTF